MLTTGRTLVPSDSAASQVVNVLGSSSTCQNIPDYPVAVHLAGGGIVDNVPIVCGGYSDDHGIQSNCYKLDRDTIQWTLLTDALPVNYREACNLQCFQNPEIVSHMSFLIFNKHLSNFNTISI